MTCWEGNADRCHAPTTWPIQLVQCNEASKGRLEAQCVEKPVCADKRISWAEVVESRTGNPEV